MKKKINIPKISVLIRAFNESKWINICLKKISEQSIKPLEIIVVDNKSNDGTVEIIKKFYKKVKVYKYNQNYAPGKMLNFSMSKCKGDYVLVISAHCIPCDNFLIENLVANLENNFKICASYARQVSLNFSDDLTIRDLMLTYGSESKLQKTDPQFNNACSIIRKSEWKNNQFDNSITNLEDRYWAAQMLKKKKFIYYSSESKVFHYHGSHHNNSPERLIKTKKTILFNKKSFGLSSDNLQIKQSDIFPIYVHNKATTKNLINNLRLIDKKFERKFLVFLGGNIKINKNNKYFIYKREKKESSNQDFYLSDVLNYYKKIILKYSQNKEYLLICSDNFNSISSSFLKRSIKVINDCFPDTIFAAKKTSDPIFLDDGDETTRLNKLNKSRKENKPLLIGKRNNGILIHVSNLFKVDKFGGIIKLIY
jgi:rhamnosyltransferase